MFKQESYGRFALHPCNSADIVYLVHVPVRVRALLLAPKNPICLVHVLVVHVVQCDDTGFNNRSAHVGPRLRLRGVCTPAER